MQKSTDRSRRRHGPCGRDPARQAGRQGIESRVAHHRRRRGGRLHRRQHRRAGRNQQRNRLRRQERRLPGLANLAAKLVAENNPADVAALAALPVERQDLRRSAHGTDRQNRREHDGPPLPAFRDHRQAGFLPARHPHRRDRRVRRRRRASRQGRRHAHRRDEAGVAVVRPGAGRTDRERAFGCRS